jgi:hypothetical protein
MDHSRRVAARLEQTIGAVATIGRQQKKTPASKIYYRRDNLEEARSVANALWFASEIDELEADGWVDVIVVLGQDAAPR